MMSLYCRKSSGPSDESAVLKKSTSRKQQRMDVKIQVTSQDIVEESEIGSLKKCLNNLSKSLTVANIRDGRDSKLSELKWLLEME